MTFLPNGYEVPKASSGYMSFEKGANKFLALGSAVIGWEYWNTAGKPVRLDHEPEETPADIRRDEEGKPEKIKHFWAFPVWNYADERVQILEVTQSTIMQAIQALVRNSDWGTPVMQYALNVNREGDGLTTKYTVQPSPQKEIPEEVLKAWEETHSKGFDLKRLFTGGNPFSAEEK